jgi:hypothetical protein
VIDIVLPSRAAENGAEEQMKRTAATMMSAGEHAEEEEQRRTMMLRYSFSLLAFLVRYSSRLIRAITVFGNVVFRLWVHAVTAMVTLFYSAGRASHGCARRKLSLSHEKKTSI